MTESDKVLLVQAALDGDLDAAAAGSRAAHRADCPVYQAAATELMLARALIGEGLYQHVPELPPADEQIVNMLVAPVDDRGDRPAIWSPDRSQRLTENELSDFSRLWHDGCGEAIIEAQDVDRNHSTEV